MTGPGEPTIARAVRGGLRSPSLRASWGGGFVATLIGSVVGTNWTSRGREGVGGTLVSRQLGAGGDLACPIDSFSPPRAAQAVSPLVVRHSHSFGLCLSEVRQFPNGRGPTTRLYTGASD